LSERRRTGQVREKWTTLKEEGEELRGRKASPMACDLNRWGWGVWVYLSKGGVNPQSPCGGEYDKKASAMTLVRIYGSVGREERPMGYGGGGVGVLLHKKKKKEKNTPYPDHFSL